MPVFTVPQERTFHSTDHSLNTFNNNNNNKKINRKAPLNNSHLNAAIHRLKGLNRSRSKALLTIYSVIEIRNIREKGKHFSSLYLLLIALSYEEIKVQACT